MASLPLLALAGVAVFLACAIPAGQSAITRWQVPAVLAAAFFAYSLWPVLTIGPLGFWPERVSDPWSVQIWFDLQCAIGVGWALLAMLARVLYRESAAGAATA